MSESVQAVLALLMIVGTIGSVLVFVNDRVDWAAFAGLLALALGSLAGLVWSLFRRDKVPDLLKSIPGPAFERDGFLFKVVPRAEKGRCDLDVYFQSRHDRPSEAAVVLQPSKGFFLVRPGLASLTVAVACPPGGYGVASVPWPVAKRFQGKAMSLDVAADVRYPEGRGTLIRYRGGMQVGPAGFDPSRAVLAVAAALGESIVLNKPARLKLRLPDGVAEAVDDDLPITSKVLWRLGDANGPSPIHAVADGHPIAAPDPEPRALGEPLEFSWEVVAAGDAGPGPRSRHGLVYDRAAGEAVLFGGCVWVGGGKARLPADTWALRDGRWSRVATRQGPCGRHRGAMAHDAARGVAVLFGGQNLAGENLGDTWLYADRRWRPRRTRPGRDPSPRCGHAMAFDEGRREMVLFGGIDEHDHPLGDTWVFDGAWRRVDGPAPPPRRYAALAYDPGLDGCLLHGGAIDDHGRQTFGDAWLFRDRAWSPLPDSFATDPRDDHGLAYHRHARTLVMLEDLDGPRGLLALAPDGWRPAPVEPLHARHQCAPLAWDDTLGGLVLHGGEIRHGGPQLNATIVLRLAPIHDPKKTQLAEPFHEL